MTKTEFFAKVEAFFKKWYGKNDDFDGAYPHECVDTAKRFMNEVCNIKNPPATGTGWADGYWTLREDIPAIYTNFKFIYKIADLQKGDIVLFRPSHVAIYTGDNRVFGQNQEGKHDPNSYKPLSYFKQFLGALRYKYTEPVTQNPTTGTSKESAYARCASDVIKGMYGNGHENRADNIYNAVRQDVNNIITKNVYTGGYITDIAYETINGRFGNGHEKRKQGIYNLVRAEVNRLLK